MQWTLSLYASERDDTYDVYRVGTSADLSALGSITYFDGVDRTKLGENEVLLPSAALKIYAPEANVWSRFSAFMTETYGSGWKQNSRSIMETVENLAIERYVAQNGEIHDPTIHRQILTDAYRQVYELLLGREADDRLPLEFYQIFFWSFTEGNYVPAEQRLTLTAYAVQNAVIYEEAYLLLLNNPSLLTSEDFYWAVIYNTGLSQEEWNEWENKMDMAANAYVMFLQNGYENEFGSKSYADLEEEGLMLYFDATGESMETYLSKLQFKMTDWYGNGAETIWSDLKVVGVFRAETCDLIVSDTLDRRHRDYCAEYDIATEVVEPHVPGIYAFAIAPMPTDSADIRKLVELSFDEESGIGFRLQNQVMNTLSGFNEFIEIGAKVFLYIGLGFAVFSALMLMNFISISISYKRREIGILRAVGARSSDVFKIFFCEAFIIALINYVLSVIATVAATTAFNVLVRNEGLNVTLLHFGIRQIALMFLISTLVAALASFFPVWNIARRKPVDAIKNK